MSYYVFKRFSEVDPARAHAKVTHARLEAFPIPAIDFDDDGQRKLHDEVVSKVVVLLAGDAEVGGPEDMQIDVILRRLWQLSPDDGLHVNMELAQVPEGQVLRELFPRGLPKQILRTATSEHAHELTLTAPSS